MEIRELKSIEEMLPHLGIIKEFYPHLNKANYRSTLEEMVPFRYHQLGVFENNECLAICGYWLLTKIWCGKYLELDNVVVKKSARSQGIGALINKHLVALALEEGCKIMALDAFTENFKAHKFYHNHGFGPRGFHFVKFLEE
ncbi:MAG: GNAT superfamily N-acetyltransferase [Psychromonas sp.]|jgi:GNAT superfamily N-acetyltransferase